MQLDSIFLFNFFPLTKIQFFSGRALHKYLFAAQILFVSFFTEDNRMDNLAIEKQSGLSIS